MDTILAMKAGYDPAAANQVKLGVHKDPTIMTTSETTKARNETATAESKTADDKRKTGRSEGAAEAAKAVKADKASQAETKTGITAEIKHLRATTNMAPKKAMDDNDANKASTTFRRNHSASLPTE